MHRISLDDSDRTGEHNAYLFPGDPTTLVDPGAARPPVRATLEAGLADHGLTLADVDRVVLTHAHPDCAGLAPIVQRAGDATIHVHEADAPLVGGDAEALAAVAARRQERFEEWNVPEATREEREASLDGLGAGRVGLDATVAGLDAAGDGRADGGLRAEVTPFADGDRLDAGSDELAVVHAPGHTAGHCLLVARGTGEVLTGDALPTHDGPTVGGTDVRLDGALAQSLETLSAIRAAGFDTAWPGRGDPIDDPTGLARDVVDRHVERARRILVFLDHHGPVDTWAVGEHLFGECDGVEALHAVGEAYALLEHMEAADLLVRTAVGYHVRSAAADMRYRADAADWPLA